MKAYIATSGTIFGVITLAHIFRVYAEGVERAKDPWFLATTAIAVALTVWAWRAWRHVARS